MEFDLSDLQFRYRRAQCSRLEADDIFARTKIDLPDEIRLSEWEEKTKTKNLKISCPPRSFSQFVLTRK